MDGRHRWRRSGPGSRPRRPAGDGRRRGGNARQPPGPLRSRPARGLRGRCLHRHGRHHGHAPCAGLDAHRRQPGRSPARASSSGSAHRARASRSGYEAWPGACGRFRIARPARHWRPPCRRSRGSTPERRPVRSRACLGRLGAGAGRDRRHGGVPARGEFRWRNYRGTGDGAGGGPGTTPRSPRRHQGERTAGPERGGDAIPAGRCRGY